MDLIRIKDYIGNPYIIRDNNLIPYSYKSKDTYGVVFIKPRNIFHDWLLMNMSYASLSKISDCVFYHVIFNVIEHGNKNNFFDNDVFSILNNCYNINCVSTSTYLRIDELEDYSVKNDSSYAPLLKFSCDNINKIIKSHEEGYEPLEFIIGSRIGYCSDPDKMDEETYIEETDRIIGNYYDAGFVDINEYCGFDGSIPFIYIDKNSSYPIIGNLKSLYKDKLNILNSVASQNSKLRKKLIDEGVQFFILEDGRCVDSVEEYFYETMIVDGPEYYYTSSSRINEEFDKICKKFNYTPSKRWSIRDYLVNEKHIPKMKKSIDPETGLVCSGKSYINVYQGIMLKD